MYSFADYDEDNDRYILKGAIPAQESLRASETINPPFELSYWHFALSVAQEWRERKGEERNLNWDRMISKLSTLKQGNDQGNQFHKQEIRESHQEGNQGVQAALREALA